MTKEGEIRSSLNKETCVFFKLEILVAPTFEGTWENSDQIDAICLWRNVMPQVQHICMPKNT